MMSRWFLLCVCPCRPAAAWTWPYGRGYAYDLCPSSVLQAPPANISIVDVINGSDTQIEFISPLPYHASLPDKRQTCLAKIHSV